MELGGNRAGDVDLTRQVEVGRQESVGLSDAGAAHRQGQFRVESGKEEI